MAFSFKAKTVDYRAAIGEGPRPQYPLPPLAYAPAIVTRRASFTRAVGLLGTH